VRVEPLLSVGLALEEHSADKGEIRVKTMTTTATQTTTAPVSTTSQFRFKFNLEPSGENKCVVKAEASTAGVTDVGLGQLTLRQLLITLSLAQGGKLPVGSIPVFFLDLPVPPFGSPHAKLYDFVNRGYNLARRGQADDAIQEWEAALRINPQCVEVFFHKGVLHMLLDDLEQARKDFGEVTRLDPQHLLAKLYYDDITDRLKKRPVEPKPQVNMLEEAPTKRGNLAGAIPTLGSAPGGGHNPVNEEDLPTQVLKRIFNSRLLLKGEGVPITDYEIKEQIISIGRQEDNTIIILNGKVSRHHARIITQSGVSKLVDMGSANGTLLNGRRLATSEQVDLYNGDLVKLGDVDITYINPQQAARPVVTATPTPLPPQRRPAAISPQERFWALNVLGLNPAFTTTPQQIEAQSEVVRRYWEDRVRTAYSPQLRAEAESRLADVARARTLLLGM
jgi:hypothetical protein